jgi:UDP-3-O-[3-hydroxymyristoyl] glucosamine N-acyltransferase
MPLSAAEIAKQLGGEVLGDGGLILKGFAPADRAQPGDLTFAENESYFARAEVSAAAAVIVDGPYTSNRKVLIRVPNARIAFAKVLPLFFPGTNISLPGSIPVLSCHQQPRVDPSAHIGPYCVLRDDVRVGARSVLQGGNYIGIRSVIGEDCNLFPNVTVYPTTEIGNRVRIHSGTVLGSDGFGYVQDGGIHRKVPQIGSVIIRDDVEIGANVTVDRGALGPTIIGRGTKIDNWFRSPTTLPSVSIAWVVSQAGVGGQFQARQLRCPGRTSGYRGPSQNR